MIRRPAFIAAARALNGLFFLATSMYCVLTSSPFAYEQFIKPNMSLLLTNFVMLHGILHVLVLSVTLLTIAPHLERPRVRTVGWSYLAVSVAVAVWLLTTGVLPHGDAPQGSMTLAFVAYLLPIWLSVFDHAAAPPSAAPFPASDRRIIWSALAAAVFVWAVYVAVATLRLSQAGAGLSTGEAIVAVLASLVAHAGAFTAIALVALTATGAARVLSPSAWAEYWAIGVAAVVAFTLLMHRIVFAPIAVEGASSWLVAAAGAGALVLGWSGIVRWRVAGNARPLDTLDWWTSPLVRRRGAAVLLALPGGAYIAADLVARLDWDFMFQKLGAAAIWLIAFALVYALTSRAKREWAGPRSFAVAAAVLAVVAAASRLRIEHLADRDGNPRSTSSFAIDRYIGGDPSFRLIRDASRSDTDDGAELFSVLRAHSTITGGSITPPDIDFVHRISPPSARPPHVFFFVIDSLRRDYVGAYNKAVTFTPNIDRLAADGFAFERAFSRYGGTALAVPSMWAGAMQLHKEYVTPFAPMNALRKLLDAKGYRMLVTEDHITSELFMPDGGATPLDRGVPEMRHSFCGTMQALQAALDERADDRPIFAHTRPLDLHVSNVRAATVPDPSAYAGFFPPYAAQVQRIDRCLGEFVGYLRAKQLYEDSIVIVTSDHGDSLGEDLRWGHGVTVFPEVLQVPLIVRLPAPLKNRFTTDLWRASFGTDVTPSLFALLGETPALPGPIYGGSLFMPRDGGVDEGAATVAPNEFPRRKRDGFLVASSYGPVYGVLRANGRTLYIVDALYGREYAYELAGTPGGRPIAISESMRAEGRALIREQVEAIAQQYRFTPKR